MRWFAAATISITLCGAVFGCGSDGGAGTPNAQGGQGGGTEVAGGGAASAGKPGGSAGSGSGKAGAPTVGEGGEAGSALSEAGSGGVEEAAGAEQGGSSGSAGSSGSGGTGGSAPIPTVPDPPTDLVLQVVTSTSVHLAWTDHAKNETGFNVYWSATVEKPATPNATVAADVVVATAEGLTANQEYNFWVEGANAVGVSTSITGKATPIPVPAQPTGLTVTGGATDASLNWNDAATTETGYRIYFSPTSVQPSEPQYEIAPNSTMYTVSGVDLTPYVKFNYWVVAYNVVGNSAPATGFATTGVLPSAPTVVSVDPKESVWYVKVSWIDNSPNSSSYNIYWSTDDTKPALPGATVDGSFLSYRMTAPKGNQTYRFWVESVNAIGKSTATKGTATQVSYELAWNELYYDINSNTIRESVYDTFGLLADNDASSSLWGYHTTNSTLGTGTALGPSINWNPATAPVIDVSTTQFFWAEARTSLGSTFAVRSLAPVGSIASLTATPSNLSVALSWPAATGATVYQILKGSTNVYANATSLGTVGGTSYTATNLNPGLPFTFWVRALGTGINGPGLPSPTVTQSVTTTGTQLGTNLALGKTAVASSATGDVAKNVVDGNIGSRWQAVTKNLTEWIYVDLGATSAKPITDVKLIWEAAYASSFDLEVCATNCTAADSTTWTWVNVYNGGTVTLTGFPNYQLIHLTTAMAGRYVRMKPKSLGGGYPASLYEFEVYAP